MLCRNCKAWFPYLKTGDCPNCGLKLGLSAEDIIGDSPKRIVSEIRPPQVDLAKVVEEALMTGRDAITEAGTGTGKSLAVLIPPILAGGRVVVSTATTLLQHQYMEKDLPFLAAHLAEMDHPFKFAVAKGRSHYLCPSKLETHLKKNQVPRAFLDWAKDTVYGDKLELGNQVPSYWRQVCAEDCAGASSCKFASECGLIAARRQLATADVIVANHSMVGYNIRLGRRLLPEHEHYIMDEAHQAAAYMRKAFASVLNELTLPNLATYLEQSDALPTAKVFDEKVKEMLALNSELFDKFKKKRDGSFELLKVDKIKEDLEELDEILDFLGGPLAHAYSAKKMAKGVLDPETRALCEKFCVKVGGKSAYRVVAPEAVITVALRKVERACSTIAGILSAATTEENGAPHILYVQYPKTKKQNREIVYAPVFVNEILQKQLFPFTRVIATSATLTVGNNFDHFREEMGFDENALTYITASPFDYEHRSMLYCSKNVPLHPSRAKVDASQFDEKLEEYYDAMAEEITDLVDASEGHAFALFTNRVEMQEVFRRVDEDCPHPCRMQDETSTTGSLEEWFRETNNPVLFGLKSFWEGISVEGDQLRLVIITKAPFPIQGDPVYQAKKELLEKQYGNWFKRFQKLDIPAMITDVKQGTGRLIRTKLDYGVAAILDRKVSNDANKPRSYASLLINSLPFTIITASLKNVKQFLRQFEKAK